MPQNICVLNEKQANQNRRLQNVQFQSQSQYQIQFMLDKNTKIFALHCSGLNLVYFFF